jgi:hypothetical protein
MSKFWIGVVMLMAMGTWARAEATSEPADVAAPAASEESELSLLSLDANVDVTTSYFFRGYAVQTGGFIVQPGATLSLNLDAFQDVCGWTITPYVGNWNSMHSRKSPSSPKWWYESDYFVGATFEKGPVSLEIQYTYYDYPGEAFRSSQELELTLAYDDSELVESAGLPFAFHPSVGIFRDLNRSAVFDSNDPRTYLELAIAPEFEVEVLKNSVTLSVPAVLGMGLDDYYLDSNEHGQLIGFASIGLAASVPLGIPEKYGQWTLNASVTYLQLIADSVREADGDRAGHLNATVGIGFSI